MANWGHYLIQDHYTDRGGCTPILSQYYDSTFFDFYHEKMDGIGRWPNFLETIVRSVLRLAVSYSCWSWMVVS